jgi:hypothetical protein
MLSHCLSFGRLRQSHALLGVVKAFVTIKPEGGLPRKGLPLANIDIHEGRIDFDAVADAPRRPSRNQGRAAILKDSSASKENGDRTNAVWVEGARFKDDRATGDAAGPFRDWLFLKIGFRSRTRDATPIGNAPADLITHPQPNFATFFASVSATFNPDENK